MNQQKLTLQTSRHLGAAALLLFIFAIPVANTSVEAQSSAEWHPLADMPVGKWEPGTVVLDGKLYVFGGYTLGVISSKRAEVYNPKDGSWTLIQELPSAITHMNAVLDGRIVWFAGGFKDGYKGHAIAEVWSYDVDLNRYTAAPLLPESRAGGGLAIVDRKMHYFGGLMADRDTDSSDHWVLDLDEWAKGSATWTNASGMPVPRNQFSTVVLNEKIYAIGGQFHHDSAQLDQSRVDIYDPQSDSWSSGPNLPKGHSHAEGATFVHDEQIYMLGGHTTPAGGIKSRDGDILSLAEGGEWQKIGELPEPLSSPAGAIIGDKMYVAGGAAPGSTVIAKMWVRSAP
jgi:N-acetylneuraminic acid mutarotase|tara:strand:- start:32 stop:1057 length:1026 start_codon:yes stop_codon:yes gene_type:complete